MIHKKKTQKDPNFAAVYQLFPISKYKSLQFKSRDYYLLSFIKQLNFIKIDFFPKKKNLKMPNSMNFQSLGIYLLIGSAEVYLDYEKVWIISNHHKEMISS